MILSLIATVMIAHVIYDPVFDYNCCITYVLFYCNAYYDHYYFAMGLFSELYGLTGGYAPSGAYSLCVYSRSLDGGLGKKLGEHFFVVGPARYHTSYHYKISAKATYQGASIADFGEGIHSIELAGKIGAYHAGPVRTPSLARDKLFGKSGTSLQAEDFFKHSLSSAGFADKPGYFDFFDLLWLLHDARNPERFERRKPESFASADLQARGAEQMYNEASALGLKELNSENSVMVFCDHDLARRYEVVYHSNAFEISQSADDPYAWTWRLALHVVRDLSAERVAARQTLPSLEQVLPKIISDLDELTFAADSLLRQISDAVEAIANVQKAKEELLLVLAAADERLSMQGARFWDALSSLQSQNERLASWLASYYLPNVKGQAIAELVASEHIDYSTNNIRAQSEELTRILVKLEASALLAEGQRKTATISRPARVESWEDLALYLYGDVRRARELALLNPPASSPAGLEQIRIGNASEADQGSAVLQTHAKDVYYGRDLDLTQEGDFRVSEDLAILDGLPCLAANLLDRLRHPQGSVPLHAQWGMDLGIASLPEEFLARVGPLRVMDNLYQDENVRSVELSDVQLRADRLDMKIRVLPEGQAERIELEASVGL